MADKKAPEAAERKRPIDKDLVNADVVTQYKEAARIANLAVEFVVKRIQSALSGTVVIAELCQATDAFIVDQTSKIFKAGKIVKGVAMPTSICCNEIVQHYAPVASTSAASAHLHDNSGRVYHGDLVKVDLAVHVDGEVAAVAHSFVAESLVPPVGSDGILENNSSKRNAVLHAVHAAAEQVLRVIRPGNSSRQVSETVARVAADYGCHAVQGVFSYRVSRFVPHGEETESDPAVRRGRDAGGDDDDNGGLPADGLHEHRRIPNAWRFCFDEKGLVETSVPPGDSEEAKAKEFKFQSNEAYFIDIMLTTGTGKVKRAEDDDKHTTLFQRNPNVHYQLKMKASRGVFADILKRYPARVFHARDFEPAKLRVTVKECEAHGLIQPCRVLVDKPGEYVARVKFTALLLPQGKLQARRITGLPFKVQPPPTKNKSPTLTPPDASIGTLSAVMADGPSDRQQANGPAKTPAKTQVPPIAVAGIKSEVVDGEAQAAPT